LGLPSCVDAPGSTVTVAAPPEDVGARSAIGTALASVRAALANPQIRRVVGAWSLGIAGDWVLLVALLVVAYQAGGPLGVGILGLVRMVPATIVGTLAGVPAARFGSARVLLAANVIRLAAAVACAVAVGMAAPVGVVFIAAGIGASAGALVRPVQSALLPSLARVPEELVASNVVSSLAEALGTFIGPLVGGILIVSAGTPATLGFGAVLFAVAAIAVARLDVSEDRGGADGRDPAIVATVARPSIVDGFRAVAARPGPALILVGFLSQTIVRGTLITLIVVTSLELLGLGDAGIGWLNAAIGLGGLAGALAAASLTGRVRLSRLFAVSLCLWGLPIAVIGALPIPVVALGAMFVTGISNAALDVSGITVLQRSFPARERFAAFGLLEGSAGLGVALGGILAPILLAVLGVRGALAVTGAVLPIVAVTTWPRISRLEVETLVPEDRLRLLRRVPLFAPLSLSVLDRIAGAMSAVLAPAGQALMREGEPGDRYVVIESGSVEVSAAGRPLRTLGAGDGIGEIALLRDIPRTATVTTLEPTRVLELDAASFKAAMAGPAAWAAAEATMTRYLDDPPA
jgi:MFS family permease